MELYCNQVISQHWNKNTVQLGLCMWKKHTSFIILSHRIKVFILMAFFQFVVNNGTETDKSSFWCNICHMLQKLVISDTEISATSDE